MCQQRLRMIVGLGNPGEDYAATRHNAGFLVLDAVARAYSISLLRKKFNALYGRGGIEGKPVLLLKPLAFMNRSGTPVRQVADYFHLTSKDMVVIHDDIDLEFGRLKIKQKGGDGGHKGLRSIIDAFGGGDFTRLRVGIGREEPELSVSGHVLSPFNGAEKKILEQIIARARDAIVTILCMGTMEAMNRFNTRRITLK